jgi:flagellar hook-associated protein 2
LDVNSIVSQLMAIERQPITDLQTQQTQYQTKLSAYGQVKSVLAAFQTAAQGLSDPKKFQVYVGTVSDSSVLSASTDSSASPASYQIETTQLAQQHKISSGAYTSMNDVAGTGSLTLQFGTYDGTAGTFTLNDAKPAASITIDASNNTLAGVRDAINAANAGVSAGIINDGTGYRLVLTSKDSGVANSIKLTAADGDGNNTDTSGLSALAYDPMAASGSGRNLTQVEGARNALFSIDGIAISKSSNTVSDAIQGVTLTLGKKNIGQPVSLSVDQDSKSISAAAQAFVKAYNDANKLIRSLSAANAQAGTAAPLNGDGTLRGVASQLRSILSSSLSAPLTSLSQAGITFQLDGTLALDSTKFQAALMTNSSAVAGVFSTKASTPDSQIGLVATTKNTQAGSYSVDITALATRGQLTGSQAANLVISAGVNDQVTLQVDGVNTSVTLTPGTYATATALAAELQTRINATSGVSAAVSQSAGVLSITSNNYGSGTGATVTGGSGATGLFGAAPTSQAGQDVSGQINGQTATGHGQILTANAGSPAEGISILVSGGALGARGNLTYAEGIAKQLDRYLDGVLGTSGGISARTEGINTSIKRLSARQTALESQMTLIEKRYRAQFAALDTMISSMNKTSSFLTQQLASITNMNSNK